MKLYNYELEPFIKFLHSLPITNNIDSRMRTRLKKLLSEKLAEFYEEMQDINKKYCEFDGNGQPVVKDEKIVFRDNDKRLTEILELSKEEVVIEENAERKAMLLSVSQSILNYSPSTFEGNDADAYDRFCEIVEQIQY